MPIPPIYRAFAPPSLDEIRQRRIDAIVQRMVEVSESPPATPAPAQVAAFIAPARVINQRDARGYHVEAPPRKSAYRRIEAANPPKSAGLDILA